MSDTENLQDPARPIVEGRKIGKRLYDIMMTDISHLEDQGRLRPEIYEKMGMTINPELLRSVANNYSEEIAYISSENKGENELDPGYRNLGSHFANKILPNPKLLSREDFVDDYAASLPKAKWYQIDQSPSTKDTKETLMGAVKSGRAILNAALERQSRAEITAETVQASADIHEAKGMLRSVYETGVTEATAMQYVEEDLDALKNIRAGLLLGEMGQRSRNSEQGAVR